MAQAGRVDAGLGELVVQPGRGAVTEVGADRGVDRPQHLEQDEGDADRGQWPGQRPSGLDGAHEHAHDHRERSGQQAPDHEQAPPQHRQRPVGPAERDRESYLLALAEPAQAAHVLPASTRSPGTQAR
jgi:hypothetical protein